ncbi:MAG TPA: peptidylprolyl isomerase [Steroidobacter sp.]|uniref:peptidylprolyl isomerase n=1 Tax=Steroidobacter sp. TaxID=1978227 RepID=UPI002ED7D651
MHESSLGQPAPCHLFVGDTAISEADIAREMQYHRAVRPQQARADAARALVIRELLSLEAARLGLSESIEPIGQESREEACIRQLLEREVGSRVPDEDECRRYYEHNRAHFRSPDRLRIRHILLAAPADDVAARLRARTLGEQLIAELRRAPWSFADLAARHSDCPSKSDGGELGLLERGRTVPEFDRQVFRLQVGLAAFPVESRWGYHVVSIDEIVPGEPLDFAQVREQIANRLELQVRQLDIQRFLILLRDRYGVRGLDEIEAAAT